MKQYWRFLLLSNATMDINLRKKTTLLLLLMLSKLLCSSQAHPDLSNEKKIGVILDMGSLLGKTLNICIKLSTSDFYAVSSHYIMRIDLHTRDSNGEASCALSAVHHLLNKVKVQAILVLDSSLEGNLLALFADKEKVPFVSFAWIPLSTQNPYMFQITPDVSTLSKGIASVLEAYRLTDAIILYEGTNSASQSLQYFFDYFKEKNIVFTYRCHISPSSSHDQILEQLGKVIAVGTTTVILHMSTSLASEVLLCANMLRMVNVKYTWIRADMFPDILYPLDSEAIKSMEGSLSLKPYVPESHKLLTFISRWNKEYDKNYPTSEAREMSVVGMQVYDVIWALAHCVEKAKNRTKSTVSWESDVGMRSEVANDNDSLIGPLLVNEISLVRFEGLNGEFQFINGKLVSNVLEITEVRGLKESKVGFWTSTDGIVRDLHPSSKSSFQYSDRGFKATLWSQESLTTQNRKMLQTTDVNKKFLIVVPTRWTFKELVNEEQDLETNTTTYNGFCIDVAAMSSLPYEYELVTFPEPEGQSSKSYDDLVYQVYLQKYDGAVADLTILANRSKKVDFTLTYTDLGVGTIAKIHEHKDMWIFFKPFGVDVWLTITAAIAVVGYVVWLFEHPINELFQGSAAQQIGTTLWFVFMSIFFAQRERLLSSWAKYILIVWLFILLILIACYTAILSSLLTVQQIQIASKGQIIGYRGGSFVQGVLRNNINFVDYSLRQYSTCKDYVDALSKGGKKGGADAIVDEIPYLKICLAQHYGFYSIITTNSTTNGFGFAFQKGSPLVHDLSMEIAKLREDGTLGLLENKWFKGSSYLRSPDSADTNLKVLKFGDLSGLFLIGAIAFGLAIGKYVYKVVWEKVHFLNQYVLIIVAEGRLTMMLNYIYPRNQGWTIT